MPKPAPKSDPQSLEQRIRDDAWAQKALDTLVARGAEKDELWSCLQALETTQLLGFSSWKQRSTLTKRQAKKLAGRLNTDADEIRAFFAPDLYWYLTDEQQFGWIELLQRYLKRMADLIDELARSSDDRGADDARPAKTRLTEYVRKSTGKPHDKEVADLIRVTLCLGAYTAEEQRKFRTRRTKTGLI
jgi:hypothetical protein